MIAASVTVEEGVVIHHPDLVNLYGCRIGSGSRIGTFVEIQRNAVVGRNCKISSHSFICEGVTLEDGVFVGHGVMFTNDLHPRAVNPDGSLQTDADWAMVPTLVKQPRVHRQQRHHPRRRDHRRGRPHRRGCRGHAVTCPTMRSWRECRRAWSDGPRTRRPGHQVRSYTGGRR